MVPIHVEGGKETYFPWSGTATRYQVGDTTWWLWKSYVPELKTYMWAIYGHSRSSGYVGRGTIRLVGSEGTRPIREAPAANVTNCGPDVWYAPEVSMLVTIVKPQKR
jgi:hypothetical protein